jgi:hypothetical protein
VLRLWRLLRIGHCLRHWFWGWGWQIGLRRGCKPVVGSMIVVLRSETGRTVGSIQKALNDGSELGYRDAGLLGIRLGLAEAERIGESDAEHVAGGSEVAKGERGLAFFGGILKGDGEKAVDADVFVPGPRGWRADPRRWR